MKERRINKYDKSRHNIKKANFRVKIERITETRIRGKIIQIIVMKNLREG